MVGWLVDLLLDDNTPRKVVGSDIQSGQVSPHFTGHFNGKWYYSGEVCRDQEDYEKRVAKNVGDL